MALAEMVQYLTILEGMPKGDRKDAAIGLATDMRGVYAADQIMYFATQCELLFDIDSDVITKAAGFTWGNSEDE